MRKWCLCCLIMSYIQIVEGTELARVTSLASSVSTFFALSGSVLKGYGFFKALQVIDYSGEETIEYVHLLKERAEGFTIAVSEEINHLTVWSMRVCLGLTVGVVLITAYVLTHAFLSW